ncbi:hypothetical protein [Nocardioides allogilvus]|uniref:hypothetical protein n=1 Tax=Nocardioides allogilvus TaxID=2072017 RepID=UPI000D3147D1|nr:hypothetical protein [Nocardioides allogilvus]
MTNPKLTDEAVGRLPLSRARAELLEDIMATTPVESSSPVRRPRRRGTLIAVGTAAATVAALFAVPALLDSADEPAKDSSSVAGQQTGEKSDTTAEQSPAAATGDRIVLPGWSVGYTSETDAERETEFVKGAQSVSVHQRAAKYYADYLEDRRHITTPPTDGEPVSVLGKDAQLWAYSADDHTAMAEVEGPWHVEVRGSGMDKAAFVALLEQLAYVTDGEFEAALPPEFVTRGEQAAAISEMLAGVTVPEGFTAPKTQEKDPYQLGAKVAGAAACAWLDIFAEAKSDGDRARADHAAAVLGESFTWQVLTDMNAEGDYPEVVWDYAERVQRGEVPEGYRQGLGCP